MVIKHFDTLHCKVFYCHKRPSHLQILLLLIDHFDMSHFKVFYYQKRPSHSQMLLIKAWLTITVL